MNALYEWIVAHASSAPYVLFALFLLAGLNIPISIDILVIIAALISATLLPEKTLLLFFCCFFGCYFSAQLSYLLGRVAGRSLLKYKYMRKLFPEHRLLKIQNFYKKHHFIALLVGRFVPFGIRNALFMSSGMTRSNFFKFAAIDFFTCLLWTSVFFTCFYQLGSNYDTLVKYAKFANLIIFFAFGVTVIAIIWYKRKKPKKTDGEDPVDTPKS